jgi:hypothetical protein
VHHAHREPVPGYKKEPDVLRSSLRLTPLSPPPRTPSRHAGASLTAARRRRTPPVRGHRRVTWKMTPNTDPLSPPFLFNGVRHDLLVLTIPSASSRTDRSRRRRRLSEESAGGSAARDAARGATTLAGGAAEAHVDRLDPPPHRQSSGAVDQHAVGEPLPRPALFPLCVASLVARRTRRILPIRSCMHATYPRRPRWPMRPGPSGPLLPLLSFYFSSPPPTWKYPWAGPKRNPRAAQRFPTLFCSF